MKKIFITPLTFLTIGTIFVGPMVSCAPTPDPKPEPVAADWFYSQKDTINNIKNYYVESDELQGHLANFSETATYENPENIIFPTKLPTPTPGLLETINGTYSAAYTTTMFDQDNLVTKNIIFPWQKSDQIEKYAFSIHDYALTQIAPGGLETPTTLPKLETVFIGSGVQKIGYAALGINNCTFSVWFDTENIDDISIEAGWHEAACRATIDAIIKRIIIRDGQDKSAWSSKTGEPEDVIFYVSGINSF